MPLRLGPFGARVHVDSIALDRGRAEPPAGVGRGLFLGAVTSGTLYRVDASAVRALLDAAEEAEAGTLTVPPRACRGHCGEDYPFLVRALGGTSDGDVARFLKLKAVVF